MRKSDPDSSSLMRIKGSIILVPSLGVTPPSLVEPTLCHPFTVIETLVTDLLSSFYSFRELEQFSILKIQVSTANFERPSSNCFSPFREICPKTSQLEAFFASWLYKNLETCSPHQSNHRIHPNHRLLYFAFTSSQTPHLSVPGCLCVPSCPM